MEQKKERRKDGEREEKARNWMKKILETSGGAINDNQRVISV